MNKKKTAVIASIVTVGLAAALLFAATMTNLLLVGDYYVKIDNACISKNASSDGVINVGSSEPYLYNLEAVSATGDKVEIKFGASRELREGAFLKLDLQPFRGVVGWSEVPKDALPSNVAEVLD